MSILRNLLRAAQQAGPGAVDALKQQIRAAGDGPQRQLLDAARSVGITLQQGGNPAGKAILDAVAPGMSGSVRRASARPVQEARMQQAAQRLQEQRAQLGPSAPRPQGWSGSQQSVSTPSRTQQLPPRPAPVPEGRGQGAGLRVRGMAEPSAPRSSSRFIPEGATVYQPNLPNPRGPLGQFQSIYGEPSSVIQARQRMAVPVQPSAQTGPAVSPGQIAIDALGYNEPTGPLGADLLRQDPQTYKSISDMALEASRTYGRTVTAEDLLGAQNFPNRLLNPYENGGALVRTVTPLGARRQIPGSSEIPGVRIGNSDQPWGEIPIRSTRVVDLGSSPRMAAGVDVPSAISQQGDAQSAIRNAVSGTRSTDLKKLAAALGLTAAGGAGLSTLAYNMFGGGGRSRANEPNTLVPPNTTDTANYSPVLDVNNGNMMPGSNYYDPFVAAVLTGSASGGIPGQTAPSVIRTNDAASVQRQAAANAVAATMLRPESPSSYSNVGRYYQDRNAYARQPGVVGNLIEQLIQVDPRFDRPELQAWASANPGLAYEMLNNQQMPTMQQPEITTELGSNTDNNAIGNSEEQARVVLEGADPALRDATRPRMAVGIQNPFYTRPGFSGRI